MKITVLVENTCRPGLSATHGLSLYVETTRHRLLFDLGPDETLFDNAARLSIDLARVDTVILSHGHLDHGGALKRFLSLNHTALIYAQRGAFEPHYSQMLFLKIPIGLDASLAKHPQVVLLDGDATLDEELSLFTVESPEPRWLPNNARLKDANGPDAFRHEQNLLIHDGHTALLMGCGHTGAVNILNRAGCVPDLCVGGYHLMDPIGRKVLAQERLADFASALDGRAKRFCTCHCTGAKATQFLSAQVHGLSGISTGDTIEI